MFFWSSLCNNNKNKSLLASRLSAFLFGWCIKQSRSEKKKRGREEIERKGKERKGKERKGKGKVNIILIY